jgi:hypothetical protein
MQKLATTPHALPSSLSVAGAFQQGSSLVVAITGCIFYGHMGTDSWPVLRPKLVVAGYVWCFKQNYRTRGPSKI